MRKTLGVVVRLAARAVRFEVGLYWSLLRWVARRPAVPTGTVAVPYVGGVAAVLWLFIFLSAVELVALHLLLPWEPVRLVLDVLGLWGLVWGLGLAAGFRVYPHLVGDAGLVVRHGRRTVAVIAWDALATAETRRRDRGGSRALQLEEGPDGTVLHVVIGGRTNIDLALRHPLELALPQGRRTVSTLRLWADDPVALVTRAQAAGAGGAAPVQPFRPVRPVRPTRPARPSRSGGPVRRADRPTDAA
ncbi:hypothetical protein I6A84_39990 [Frankia sp. CNm7]|uniref:Uncharacterized protein n=1 Tax=Frankia nepalensis TaxID=1836974 RepID=A0A937RKB8_9ACTN|nr:hypothetical protein [Frankia nepalensis]MBL7498361.1 hypothetical protein [Frankia nepalensis]MBL7513230.1 hypothetical protein [Frankia nepalensis]MBL7524061.1 hypothetical protein [Frankia nepalensis]MBL7628914.1 hypothetical protein [Frankia nepalensis]